MAVVMSIDYETLKDRAVSIYIATIAMLVLLLLVGLAQGADRISFDFGPFNLQPAELAKFSTMLLLAAFLAEERTDEVSYPRFVGGLILVGFPAVLVIIQPDLGSASVLVALAMGTLLIAGARPKYIVAVSVLAVMTVLAAFIARLVNEYQVQRLKVFLDQETTDPGLQDAVYQVRNAIRAVGTGGLWGKGWLEGPLTNGRDIPVMWADFPFAAVAEQFGLVGCLILISLFMVVLARIWRVASLSKDVRHVHLCRSIHHGAVADVPEHRYDPRNHARDRFTDAIYFLWRLEFDRVLRNVWACAECVHAADALICYSGFPTCGRVN